MSTYCQPIRAADWHEPEPSTWDDVCSWKTWRDRKMAQALAVALAEPTNATEESSLEEIFKEHADRWQRETAHLSSPSQIMLHPSYQAVLGMGDRIVPILLRDLQQNRRPWFWALSYITKANPLTRSDAGRMDKMIEAWVKWGKQNSLL
jgi:hypothetical protein